MRARRSRGRPVCGREQGRFWRRRPNRSWSARPLAQNPFASRLTALVCLAPSGICRAGAGASAGGGRVSEPGYLPKVAVRTQAASDFAGGFGECGNVGQGRHAHLVPEGKGLLLFVRIPPDGAYTRYTAELYNPAGKLEGSFTITPTAGQDQWPVTVPGSTGKPEPTRWRSTASPPVGRRKTSEARPSNYKFSDELQRSGGTLWPL